MRNLLCIHLCLRAHLQGAPAILCVLANNGVGVWNGRIVLRHEGYHHTSTPPIPYQLCVCVCVWYHVQCKPYKGDQMYALHVQHGLM